MGALATAGLSDQDQRLVVLEGEEDVVPVVPDRQTVPLRLQVQRVMGVEHEGSYVILGGGSVSFRGEGIVIWKDFN